MTPPDPAQQSLDFGSDLRSTAAADPGQAIAATAQRFVATLEAGDALHTPLIVAELGNQWSGPRRNWNSKHAYDAAEAATVLFLRRWGATMRDNAPSPEAFLAMIQRIASLEPTHTHRNEHQVDWDQFSTPLPLACAATAAAAIRHHDTVLEPSAGTGILAVFADIAADVRLHLNELSPVRHSLLGRLFPSIDVSRHNAERIRDYRADIRPDVVVMNPPFAARPTVAKRRKHTDLQHLRSAYASLAPCGRLVAILGANCVPGSATWDDAFPSGARAPKILLAVRVPRAIYARRGTSVETRLVVLEHAPTAPPGRYPDVDPFAAVQDVADLLRRVLDLPPRLVFEAEPAHLELIPAEAPDGTANTSSVWTPWSPSSFRVPGAAEHPTPLVESAAMADVSPPAPDYTPLLPPALVLDGLLSDAQLQSIVLAGAAHDRLLPVAHRIDATHTHALALGDDGLLVDPNAAPADSPLSEPVRFRQGWMLGDGTGCGKGRQAAAIILDRWLRGTTRALWISQSTKLIEDARRDWREIGQDDHTVFPLADYRASQTIGRGRGVLFSTYATLRSPPRGKTRARLEQIIEWLAGGTSEQRRHAFDGVIVFDEAHAMANAAGTSRTRGDSGPSQQGLAGLRLQNALPNARILYASATGASTIGGLAYAPRLGLWSGDATAFTDRLDFVGAMERGGVAAMEIVARDLKALGLYQARALAYHGVEIDILEHPLTEPQRDIWDRYAGAFRIIHQNIDAALEATGVTQDGQTLNSGAKAAAYSMFEQAKQRFFAHLLASMKCPSLIRAIEDDLRNDRAPVVQLVSTGEALLDRRLAEIPADEHDDLSIDLTPREYIFEYLIRAFPTTLHEESVNDEGKIISLPVHDEDRRAIESQDAIKARDKLIAELGALPPMPAALDIILHHFGHERVAEVTGRSRRVLAIRDSRGNLRHSVRPRPGSANLAEASAFMDAKKPILVFSTAGGTGRSYHADADALNQNRRVHYLLEPGWRADVAIQGLGRTHRTRQASAPLFRPVTTDVKGERRFIATIARRLDSLGAITRGQRDSQSSMGDSSLFRAEDNLESSHALDALRAFYLSIHHDHIDGWPEQRFSEATGLTLTDSDGGLRNELPPMSRFLNRLLALPIHEQNDLFSHFHARLDASIQAAKDAGTYNQGVAAIVADSLTVTERHAGPVDTRILRIRRADTVRPTTADDAAAAVARARADNKLAAFIVNASSGRPAVLLPAPSSVREDGSLEPRVRVKRPSDSAIATLADHERSRWEPAPEARWRALWDAEAAALPTHSESHFHLVTGPLLRAWHLLPDENLRIRRLTTDAGERLIGRILDAEDALRLRHQADKSTTFTLPATDILAAVRDRREQFHLANGWLLRRRLVHLRPRLQICGPDHRDINVLRRLGCETEIISWQTVVFADDPAALDRVLKRHPLRPPETNTH